MSGSEECGGSGTDPEKRCSNREVPAGGALTAEHGRVEPEPVELVGLIAFFEDEPDVHPVLPLERRLVDYGDVVAGLCDDGVSSGFVEPDPGCDEFAVLLKRGLIKALFHLGAEVAGVLCVVVFVEAGKEVVGDRVYVGKHLGRLVTGDDRFPVHAAACSDREEDEEGGEEWGFAEIHGTESDWGVINLRVEGGSHRYGY